MEKHQFHTITAKATPLEQTSSRMDRNFRIFSEGLTTN